MADSDIQRLTTGVFNTVQPAMSSGGLSGGEFVSNWLFNTSFQNTLVFTYQKDLSTAGPDAIEQAKSHDR